MAKQKKKAAKKGNSANIGYEAQLWQMADALRGSMDAAEDKHVLRLIYLKYITDTTENQHARLNAERDEGAVISGVVSGRSATSAGNAGRCWE